MISQEWRPTQHSHKRRLRFALPLGDTVDKAAAILGNRVGFLRVLCAAIRVSDGGYIVVLEIRWRMGGFGDFELSATGVTLAECVDQLKDARVFVDAVLRHKNLESEMFAMQMDAPEEEANG
ncbi:hypothetical protein LHFGNBLO_001360 [Mesorhizobium sp. AR10]|uniref:hypothetical protein n=1 Tax=Mesorhizobium sp. AR10 TaxID=2865839 RepID=UPI00215E28C4|nr:hypothetical protein [Mesorhizobium sp. AR10]UVK39945.1 hypothetical protein LHFGNBLO_001360 [Mesorhizobium sp. AR10]